MRCRWGCNISVMSYSAVLNAFSKLALRS